MTTLGQLAYEQHNRRNDEAPDWADLLPCLQRTWEHTACAVAAAVEPTMETLRARVAQLELQVAAARRDLEAARSRAGLGVAS